MSHATWIVFRALLVRWLRNIGTPLGLVGTFFMPKRILIAFYTFPVTLFRVVLFSIFLILSIFLPMFVMFLSSVLLAISFPFGFADILFFLVLHLIDSKPIIPWLRRRLVLVPFQGGFLAWMFWDNAHSAHSLPIFCNFCNTGGDDLLSKLAFIQLPLYLVIIVGVFWGPTLVKNLHVAWKAEYNRQFPSAHAQLRARKKL